MRVAARVAARVAMLRIAKREVQSGGCLDSKLQNFSMVQLEVLTWNSFQSSNWQRLLAMSDGKRLKCIPNRRRPVEAMILSCMARCQSRMCVEF